MIDFRLQRIGVMAMSADIFPRLRVELVCRCIREAMA
jgi:hypothetical protein